MSFSDITCEMVDHVPRIIRSAMTAIFLLHLQLGSFELPDTAGFGSVIKYIYVIKSVAYAIELNAKQMSMVLTDNCSVL